MKFPALYLLLASSAFAGADPAPPATRHVVVLVWDGMRPDFVSAEHTPNLWKLARQGVTFRNHHPVYPSSTEVNGTAMATGDYPNRSGVMANREYRPGVDPLKAVPTEIPSTIRATGSNYLTVPTVVETLRQAGFSTAIAGSKGVALLQDWSQARSLATVPAGKSTMVVAGKMYPPAAPASPPPAAGPWPETIEFPNIPEDEWTARTLTETLWKEAVPAYSMLWMSDPDYSQHSTAPGSPIALAAIRSVDDRLGAVLAALDARGVRQDTDVLVISDHGFSTVGQSFHLASQLAAAGLKVSFDAFNHPPQPGEILVVGNGGSAMFYVAGHDAAIAGRLVAFLQKAPEAGVILSRFDLPGAFPLQALHIDTPAAPDVIVAFRWNPQLNRYGIPGLLDIGGNLPPGKGSHASLSHYEMHNTLIAAGPDFEQGAFDDLPTGNVDLAPTVLSILRVRPAVPMDGRVLAEAMPGRPAPGPVSHRILTAGSPDKAWSQYLKISQVGQTPYFDEGNAGPPP